MKQNLSSVRQMDDYQIEKLQSTCQQIKRNAWHKWQNTIVEELFLKETDV
jgi:hypothetical protein